MSTLVGCKSLPRLGHAASLLLLVCCFGNQNVAFGQSFLERLEQTVRQQLEKGPQESLPPRKASSGELPPPKSNQQQDAEEIKGEGTAGKPNRSGDEAKSGPLPLTGQGLVDQLQESTSGWINGAPLVPAPASGDNAGSAGSVGGRSQAQGNRPTDARAQGRVYLGIEAEDPVGGGIGVRVTGVTDQSPAWKAGFKSNDRVLAVNGFAIADINDLAEQLSKTAPGDTARFLVNRAGRNREVVAVLMDAELAGRIADSRSRVNGGILSPPDSSTLYTNRASRDAWLGVLVNDLTPSFRRQFGIGAFRGAAVTRVLSGSPAELAGIRAGDAIIEINGTPIEQAVDVKRWVSQARPGQRAEMLLYRGITPVRLELVLTSQDNGRSAAEGRNVTRGSGSRSADRVRPREAAQQASNDGEVSVEQLPPPNRLPTPNRSDTGGQGASNRDGNNANAAGPRNDPADSRTLVDDSVQAELQRMRNEARTLRDRVSALESENQQLRGELKGARKNLEQAQRRLERVLEVVRGQDN